MRATASLCSIGLGPVIVALIASAGCRNTPPPRVNVPDQTHGNPYYTYQHDSEKPLPPSTGEYAPQAQPVPLSVTVKPGVMPPAISPGYIEAYDRVGRPRLLVLIDRPDQPGALAPADYDFIERGVRETLAAGGQVATVAPSAMKERLDPAQAHDLAAANPAALASAGKSLHADVVILLLVSGSPTETRISAEARNTRDAQLLANATTTIAGSAPRSQLDYASRLLGERMVDALADAWDRLSHPKASQPAPTPPTAAPVAPPPAPPIAAPVSPPVAPPAPTPPPAVPVAPPPPAAAPPSAPSAIAQ